MILTALLAVQLAVFVMESWRPTVCQAPSLTYAKALRALSTGDLLTWNNVRNVQTALVYRDAAGLLYAKTQKRLLPLGHILRVRSAQGYPVFVQLLLSSEHSPPAVHCAIEPHIQHNADPLDILIRAKILGQKPPLRLINYNLEPSYHYTGFIQLFEHAQTAR
jgi:hypothetical protein